MSSKLTTMGYKQYGCRGSEASIERVYAGYICFRLTNIAEERQYVVRCYYTNWRVQQNRPRVCRVEDIEGVSGSMYPLRLKECPRLRRNDVAATPLIGTKATAPQ